MMLERKELLIAIQNVKSATPLFNQGKLDMVEMINRVAYLLDTSDAAVRNTTEKPRPHPDKGGWHGLRSPSPGSHSGARREPSTAWHGETRA